ncbi:MAG: DUF928 domain-containing protein [Nostoc sp. DedSLP03]|uniref:DUF928 domain-containing protein n=1 Tax=Nostoc sp. DedSLP03 TaxID=3075400 RepID=UPI002AD1F5A6|nr:DUF928 domain-containing protein [Nostoc sp. DedSLP03]MDZ7969122.1 DUF928 domain-containing protein [Nostoc sp. DedSLP03]
MKSLNWLKVILTIALLIIILSSPLSVDARIKKLSQINISYAQEQFSNIGRLSNPFQLISKTFVNQRSGQRCFFFLFCINRRKEITRPARLGDAARRGLCINWQSHLKALIPVLEPTPEHKSTIDQSESLSYSIGFTSNEYTRFWFYVPKMTTAFVDSNKSKLVEIAEFMLQDEKGNDVFDLPIPIQLSNKVGIVSFQIPIFSSNQNWLKSGQAYHWFFSIVCDSRRPSRNPSVDGWVQLADSSTIKNLQSQLQKAGTPEKRIKIYADNDLWYDTITYLVESRCADPNNPVLAQYWSDLLKEVGLSDENIGYYCDPGQKLQVADHP